MTSLAWPHTIKPRSWASLLDQYEQLAIASPQCEHLAAIVRTVVASDVAEDLAAFTSMQDLVVALKSLSDAPHEVVVVRAPGSLIPPKPDEVLIEHLSHSGRNDVIARPVADSVGLFWHFLAEKLGIHPRTQHE